jgi:hypothetical protein
MGTVDERLLRRTRGAVLGMEGSAPASAGLATLSDARMKKVSHKESFARAASPLDVVHMDVVSVSLMDLPASVDGSKLGMRYKLVCVDDHSRLKKVYFSKKKGEVPGLIRLFLLEMGTHALFGSHFVLHNGFRQLRIHTDGDWGRGVELCCCG